MNFYVDETCHLINDNSNYMVLGTLYCPKNHVKYHSQMVKYIKSKNNISNLMEIKSTKVSMGAIDFYNDLVEHFINSSDLFYRAVVVDKRQLRHEEFDQTHEDFYYKMLYVLLNNYILFEDPNSENNIYIDYKDRYSYNKSQKAKRYLNIHKSATGSKVRFNCQPINSKESCLLQMCDLLTGLVAYRNRGLQGNKAKLQLIDKIEKEIGVNLICSNRSEKCNIFIWKGREYV